jgi:hypothetical protein
MTTLNADYINNLPDQINAVNTCALLQQAADEAISELEQQAAALLAPLAHYGPLQALAEIPSDLGSLLSWVSHFINKFIIPMVAPYVALLEQQAELVIAIENLTAAIQRKATEFESCSITLHL